MSQPMDALEFVFARLGDRHRHHRHCVHNMSYEEQHAQRKRKGDGTEWTDEEMEILKLDQGIVVITSEDWEIDVPDLDWSRFDDGAGLAEEAR